MNENDITGVIIDTSIQIHRTLGPGLLESVYEEILNYELIKKNLKVVRQVEIPLVYNDIKFNTAFRADLVVENKVIVEIKSTDKIEPVHCKQLLTYLKITQIKVGLLINFNEALLKDGIKRIVNKF